MGDTFKVGEYEFKWELNATVNSCSVHIFITKPKLLKFSNDFTSGKLEEIVQQKMSSGDFIGMIRTAFKQTNPRLTVSYSFVEDISDPSQLGK